MNHEKFETAAKVLFFGTLEEPFAVESAQKTIHLNSEEDLLVWLDSTLSKKKNKLKKGALMQGSFVFPQGMDFSYWREFHANCLDDNFRAVLYKWVGGFEDELICSVLKISKGTLYSRYNKGLVRLGEFLIDRQTSLGL
jgi:hypothetical protein